MPSRTTRASGTIASVAGGLPAMKRYVSANALAPSAVSRWSMPAMTTFSAPFSAGPSKLTFVGVPRAPIQTPSGCAYLSLLSERIVIHATPGVTSLPVGALRRVELDEERPGAVELAAGKKARVRPHAVVRNAAEDGMRDDRRAAVGDEVADRIAAAREGDQRDLGGAGRGEHLLHLGGEMARELGGRAAPGLLLRIVVARERVGQVDRVQAIARPAVRLEAPDRRDPESGGVAVAVHEDDRWHVGQARSGHAG